MASALNSSPAAERFLCSICLEVFTEPVSTPCGHNYCKACIKGCWAVSDVSRCPLCKEEFQGAPELRVNIEFRDMVEVYRMGASGDSGGSPAGPGEVPCDLCHGTKRKALKSCLVCLATYCNTHLEPHHTVQALKWHQLINPVSNLEDRVCKKHGRVMEFFCRSERSCVCIVCLKNDHMMHEYVSLEVEIKERKTKLQRMKRRVSRVLNKKCTKVSVIKSSMMQDQQEVSKTKAETIKVFTALESRKVKLMELLEEKQRAAERRSKALITQLQLEIDEDNRTRIELQELSKTEDDFRLLQDLPSISTRSTTKHRLLHLDRVRSAVAKMEETIEQMENIIRELSLIDEEETNEEPVQTEKLFDADLGIIPSQFAINVTLDPNTAHPSLILSEDGKQVRDGGAKRRVPNKPVRFDFYHYVLGNEGFSSGRFYYEVLLKGQEGWEVGVTRESINRKDVALSLSPENGCWTLGSYWGRCQANANPPVVLSLSKNPEKVGVFVDYEGGLVCFYDVDDRTLIYSFTRCVFAKSAPHLGSLSFLSALRVNNDAQAKTRIFPLFRPGAESREPAPLQIL